MAVKVRIPTPLRKLTNGQEEVSAEGKTIGALIDTLEKASPGMKERLCDETGKVRRFINLYLNDEDIRFLQGLDTELKDGDEVSIIPAIAGGAPIKKKNIYELSTEADKRTDHLSDRPQVPGSYQYPWSEYQ